jgi:hypothetical protein
MRGKHHSKLEDHIIKNPSFIRCSQVFFLILFFRLSSCKNLKKADQENDTIPVAIEAVNSHNLLNAK